MKLHIMNGMGMQIDFDNGNTLSVMVSGDHHCSNNDDKGYVRSKVPFGHNFGSEDAEVCIFDKNGKVVTSKFIDCGKGSLAAGYFKVSKLTTLMKLVEENDKTPMELVVWRND